MDKRYQVFISSTFADLQEERAKVQKMIMQLDCIPAGMELFPAIDEEQLEFIKRIIDDSDYYLLIIGGRYGSISSEDGISFTEKEYDYAVSKGIKVIALLHKNPEKLSLDKSEIDANAREKLFNFRNKAATGRLVSYWDEINELSALVATSLPRTIKTYPAVGWVRGDSVPSSELYKELNDLRKENELLRDEIQGQGLLKESSNIAGLSDNIVVSGISTNVTGFLEYTNNNWSIEATWGLLFYTVAPIIFTHARENIIESELSKYLAVKSGIVTSIDRCEIDTNDFHMIRIQFRALNLINIEFADSYPTWSLTAYGEKLLIIDRSVKKLDSI